MAPKEKRKNRIKGLRSRLFARFFGFETGIDITNDVAVLYRRNVVIKNIVFISNLLYSLIFFMLGFSVANPTTDWVFAVASIPITLAVSKIQTKLIELDKDDITKQQVAMYVSSFWIFISAMLVYIRIYAVGNNVMFETASYVLIFYALVEISLYQDKKLLSNSFGILFGFVTLVHVAVTYNFFNLGLTWQEFFVQLGNDTNFRQEMGSFILRTIIFVLFYLVNYIIVSIGQSIQEERKKELIKRREVQNDYNHIVRSLFSVVFQSQATLLNPDHANFVSLFANNIANYYNLETDLKEELKVYSLIHLRFNEVSDIIDGNEAYNEETYDKLKEKTNLGAKISRRLQLAQKANDILRSTFEGTVDEDFIKMMNKIQPEIISQIILMADLYLILRKPSNYTRPHSHPETVSTFKNHLIHYFDYNLKETFLKYNDDLNESYQNL